MKTAFSLLLVNIPTIICAVASGILAYNHIEGWGWFLFAALVLGHTVSDKDKKSEDDKEGT